MNKPSLPFYQDIARQRGDAEALRYAAADVDKLRATLDELKALQVNGFDPIAAARAYEPLVEALRDRLLYATDLEYRVVADAKAAEATAGNVTHEEAQNERDAALLRELGEIE